MTAANKPTAAASAVAQFVAANMGKTVVAVNPPPPASGPITYMIHGVAEGKTTNLSKDNGGGKGEFILLKQQGDETAEPVKLNPNTILDLFRGVESKQYALGTDVAGKLGVDPATVTTEGEAGKTTTEAGADTATETKTKKVNVEAEAKKKAKLEAAEKRKTDKEAKDKKAAAEKAARDLKKAEKAKSSGKVKALRVYRGEPETAADGSTHRSRVMAKFRAPESEGGLGMSMQHANTYYQNCKGQWANEKLPTEAEQAKQDAADAAAT